MIDHVDSYFDFPPIFMNGHHDVSVLNDAAVHQQCLVVCDFAEMALRKLADFHERRDATKRCKICALPISDPEDFFGTGPLADDPTEDLASLDWFEAHAHCLAEWDGFEELRQQLLAHSNGPDWEGDAIVSILVALDALAGNTHRSDHPGLLHE